MSQRLFNEYAAENELGREIGDKFDNFLEKLILEYPQADINDFESLVSHITGSMFAGARLRHATKLRKAEKK